MAAPTGFDENRSQSRQDGAFSARSACADGTFVIALYGEFDIAAIDEVERLLASRDAAEAREVVVDLSGLHFIDSSGIRVLALAHARWKRSGARLSLMRPPELVHRAFVICGLDTVLPFVD